MSDKFSLKWNDYSSNWNKSLSKLRENSAFADVTLITDDKKKFSAHLADEDASDAKDVYFSFSCETEPL